MVFQIPEYKQARLRKIKAQLDNQQFQNKSEDFVENELDTAILTLDQEIDAEYASAQKGNIDALFAIEPEEEASLSFFENPSNPNKTLKKEKAKWRRDKALQHSNRRQIIHRNFRQQLQQAGEELIRLSDFAHLTHTALQEKLQSIGQEAFDTAYAALGEVAETPEIMGDILTEITEDQARFTARILSEHARQIAAQANQIFKNHVDQHLNLLHQEPDEFLNAVADLAAYLRDVNHSLPDDILTARFDETLVSYIQATIQGFIEKGSFEAARRFIQYGIGQVTDVAKTPNEMDIEAVKEVEAVGEAFREDLEEFGIDFKILLQIGDTDLFRHHMEKLFKILADQMLTQKSETVVDLLQRAMIAMTGPQDAQLIRTTFQKIQAGLSVVEAQKIQAELEQHQARVMRSDKGFLALIDQAEGQSQQQQQAAQIRALIHGVAQIKDLANATQILQTISLMMQRRQIDPAMGGDLLRQAQEKQQEFAAQLAEENHMRAVFQGNAPKRDPRHLDNMAVLDRLWQQQAQGVFQPLSQLRQQENQLRNQISYVKEAVKTATAEPRQQLHAQLAQLQQQEQQAKQRQAELTQNLLVLLEQFVKESRFIPTQMRDVIQQATIRRPRQYLLAAAIVGHLVDKDSIMGSKAGLTGSYDGDIVTQRSEETAILQVQGPFIPNGMIGGFQKKQIAPLLRLYRDLQAGLALEEAVMNVEKFIEKSLDMDAINGRYFANLRDRLNFSEQQRLEKLIQDMILLPGEVVGATFGADPQIQQAIFQDYQRKKAEWFALSESAKLAADMALMEIRHSWGLSWLPEFGFGPVLMRYPPEKAHGIFEDTARNRQWIQLEIAQQIGVTSQILKMDLNPNSEDFPVYLLHVQSPDGEEGLLENSLSPKKVQFQPDWQQSAAYRQQMHLFQQNNAGSAVAKSAPNLEEGAKNDH